ncbi:hypothetical protein KUTeg_000707 [Tegillarca granosa]|uniref:Homeobox domain-containing protein n=1 Tax=Tegillarca granosa TaxID=220873 RepID=A0ABQ9FYA5_TEGGR|nr:hypothetical protein KUTeg_000707 [Tegillarca granosa]
MEEGLEGSPGAVDSNLPYLPNKNAVYIVPYPFHGPYMSNNLPHDSKETIKAGAIFQENNPLPEDTPCKRLEDETVENEDHENFNNQSNVKYDEQSEDNFEDQKENGNTEEKMEVNHNGQKEALSGESQNVPPVKKEDTENSETCSNHLLNDDTHPSSYMIDKYCEELNRSDYRQKFPKLEPKNVQLWFKNHRAKGLRKPVVSILSDVPISANQNFGVLAIYCHFEESFTVVSCVVEEAGAEYVDY